MRRIHRQLLADGESSSRNRVARLMRKCQLKARRKRKYRVTTDSKHNFPVAKNLLDRQFISAGPNQVWASDITYIWTMRRLAVSGRSNRPAFSNGGGLVDGRAD